MLNVSKQAYIYTIIWGITLIINFILSFFIGGTYGPLKYIFAMAITFPLSLLVVYNIDCLTTGGCNIWSWVISVLTSLSMIFTTILVIIAATKK